MSDVKGKIIYSTSSDFIDHDKINSMIKAEQEFIHRFKTKSVGELLEFSDDLLEDDKNLTPLITIENFMYFWYPKIRAYVEEGRDIVAEKDPKNSIFKLWGKEHIRFTSGYRVGIYRGSYIKREDETNRKMYQFEVIATTPGLGIDAHIGTDAFQAIDLQHIAHNIVSIPLDTQREYEMAEFTKDLSRIHQEELAKSDIVEQRRKFKEEWISVLDYLNEYYEKYKANGGYINKEDLEKDKNKKQRVEEDDSNDWEW